MIYTTSADGETFYVGESLEDAIRAWDANTYDRQVTRGGIAVRSPLRDGYILHVDRGRIYLNPGLTDARA